jgi:hypothetical protein
MLPLQSIKKKNKAGFEILTGVTTNSTSFRDVTPCTPLEVHRRFWETSVYIFRTTTSQKIVGPTLKDKTCTEVWTSSRNMHNTIGFEM